LAWSLRASSLRFVSDLLLQPAIEGVTGNDDLAAAFKPDRGKIGTVCERVCSISPDA